MIMIYFIVILLLFNKFFFLEEGKFKIDVEDFVKKFKFFFYEFYVIDGSKCSVYSNVYFFGFFWKKYIVIYDILIEKSEIEEVVVVFVYEFGYWSLGYIIKLFGIF